MASLLAGIQSPQPVDWGRAFSSARDAIFDEQRQSRADQRDKNLLIAQYAVGADTPEKWAAAMGDLQRAGVPDAGQFANRFDLRDTLIERAYSAADQMNSRTAGQFLSSLGDVRAPEGATLSGGYLSSLGAAPPVGSVDTKPLGASLAKAESGGDPRAVNRMGYSGLYQFGEGALQTAGLYGGDPTPGQRENMDWAGTFSIPGHPEVRTQQDFLNNPEAQQAAFGVYKADLERQMKGAGMDRYIGQTVSGVPITAEGLVWMAHLGGVGGARRFLETGGRYNPADANRTRLSDYAVRGAGGGAVRPATRDVQPPAPNGVPISSLQILARNPTFAGTAVSAGINQYAAPKDTTVWARLDDGHLFNQRTGEIVTAPDAVGGVSGPFQGNSLDAQDSNILLRGDPASPEYAMAYQRQYLTPKPVQIPDPNNPGAMMMGYVQVAPPPNIRPPVGMAQQTAPQQQPAQEGGGQTQPQGPVSVQGIPGTSRLPSQPIPAEIAARIGLANQFLDNDLPAIRRAIEGGTMNGILERGQLAFSAGEPGRLYARIQSGIDALRRNLTGAGMSMSEADEYLGRYLPTTTDGSDTMLFKLAGLEADLKATRDAVLAGRNPIPELAGRSSARPNTVPGQQSDQTEQPATPKTEAEYNALPSASLYIHPDDPPGSPPRRKQ